MTAPTRIPDEVLEADICTLAQKGAGKSYANRGLVERNLDRHRRTFILDPMSIWWGLKARADGAPGYPIAVIGGPHADVPLDPTQGEALATFLAGADLSVVLDVSELRRGEMQRFAADFLSALYRLNRAALWLVLEEADLFAPQNPMGDATMLLHYVDQIARRGRNRGFRLWSLSQRPAKLHKDILSMASALILMRIRGPQDRAAAEEWIKGNADPAEAKRIVGELASLPVGEGYVYAPDVGLLERVKFPKIATLDTGRTPQHGEAPQAAGQLAAADVAALRIALAVSPPPPTIAPIGVDVEQLRADLEEQKAAAFEAGRAEGFSAGVARVQGLAIVKLQEAAASIQQLVDVLDIPLEQKLDLQAHKHTAPPAAAAPPKAPKAPKAKREAAAGPADAPLAAKADDMLAAARMAPRPVSWAEAALLAGIVPGGGFFNAMRKQLTDAGWSTPPDNDLVSEGPFEPADNLGVLYAAKLKRKGAAADRVFQHLWVKGPEARDEIAKALGIQSTGGFWNHTWKIVRGHALFAEQGGQWDIAPILRELKAQRR